MAPRRLLHLRNRHGVSLIAAVAALLVLAVLAAVLFSLISVESEVSVSQAASAEAFFIADGGLEYAIRQLQDDWTGYLGEIDKAFGAGEFDVTVLQTTPLVRQITVTSRVPPTGTPDASRSIEAVVTR